jgi:restriction system protein
MDSLDAAEKVLGEAAQPLHYKAITEQIITKELWQTEGKTPDQTVNARLAVDIKKKGDHSRFIRTAPGVFGLRRWAGESDIEISGQDESKYSFTDAAEIVLEQ